MSGEPLKKTREITMNPNKYPWTKVNPDESKSIVTNSHESLYVLVNLYDFMKSLQILYKSKWIPVNTTTPHG